MERKIDEVLDSLRLISTVADSEQLINELKQILLDPTISEGENGKQFNFGSIIYAILHL